MARSYQDKIERTLDIYGFACDCNLCKLDANDPLTKIRAQLIEQIEYKHMNRMITIPEAFTDVQKMKATYANRELKFQLIIPLQFLANKYRELFKYKQSAKCFEEMFDLIKGINFICLPEFIIFIFMLKLIFKIIMILARLLCSKKYTVIIRIVQ
jgi:hypothetical protein